MHHRVSIVIPVYKENLSRYEIISLQRAFNILHKSDFIFIGPERINFGYLREYLDNYEYRIERFEDSYFDDIYGYNKVFLEKDLHQRLCAYDYFLIYQLDAYIFKDNLSTWVQSGYDNIGGPWFSLKTAKLKKNAGNGGFCLRSLQACIQTLEINRVLFLPYLVWVSSRELPLRYLWKYRYMLLKMLWPIFKKAKKFVEEYPFYEDKFWAEVAPVINRAFKVCPAKEAMKFSFDAHPEQLYVMNNHRLPMGAHAWYRHERLHFWNAYIPELKDSHSNN